MRKEVSKHGSKVNDKGMSTLPRENQRLHVHLPRVPPQHQYVPSFSANQEDWYSEPARVVLDGIGILHRRGPPSTETYAWLDHGDSNIRYGTSIMGESVEGN